MKHLLSLACALLIGIALQPASAFAQVAGGGGVHFQGPPTPGDCVAGVNINTIKDAGSCVPTFTGDMTNAGTVTTVSKVSGAGTPTNGQFFGYTTAGGQGWYTVTGGSFPTCTLGQLVYYAAGGSTVSCLTLGTNLSITSGTLNATGTGGSGTVNAAAQYATPYYSAAGSSSTLSGLASPTSGAGYYVLRYDPTSTTAVAPTADQVGAGTRSLSGATTTDTVLYSDVLGVIVHDKAATGAVTETLPTPTSLGNSNFAFNYCNDSAQTDTIQPTTYQIAVNGGTAGASISIGPGVCASVLVDPFNASQWDAFTYGAGGSSVTFPTGVLYGNNSPAAPTVATSAQIATALSSTPQAITVSSCTGCGSGSTFLNLTSDVTTPSGGAATTVLTFSASANTSYYVTCHFSVSVNAGSAALVLTGPASPTSLVYFVEYNSGTLATAYGTNVILGTTTAQKPANGPTVINLQNGATAGTVTLQITNPGGGTDTATAYAGSFCRVN